MRYVKAIWGGWLTLIRFLFTRVFVLLVFIVGLYWTYVIFASLKEDTTNITNAAFAIVATLAALAFSCARAIKNSEGDSDRFAYAGERFLHGAVLLICASVLKYAYIKVALREFADPQGLASATLATVVGVIVGVLFFWALSSAHGGLIVLNKLLWARFNRYSDWDDFM